MRYRVANQTPVFQGSPNNYSYVDMTALGSVEAGITRSSPYGGYVSACSGVTYSPPPSSTQVQLEVFVSTDNVTWFRVFSRIYNTAPNNVAWYINSLVPTAFPYAKARLTTSIQGLPTGRLTIMEVIV